MQRLVIAGGGTAGWMAAALLARFRPRASITLVESDAIGTIGVGEATVPTIRQFNAVLGIDEPAFVRATGATFKLGIEFVDWGRAGNRHFHGFGDHGSPIEGALAHHGWLRLRERLGTPVDRWSMPAVLAAGDRFAPPEALRGEAAEFSYAYHFDAGLYARFLRSHAEGRGVSRVEGRILAVERREDGDVAALRLDADRRIEGDIFLDCSGFHALLLGGELGVGYRDWSHWLPCDRAMAVPSERAGRLTPFTRSTAHAAGWQWRIPLQHRTGNGLVFASSLLSDDQAAALLLAKLDGAALADPRPIGFTTGRRARFWERNVIAIGLAAGFMEPLESTSIQLIQSGLQRLLTLLPDGPAGSALRDEYNRQTAGEYERVRDFLIAHYCVSQRPEPMWREVRGMPLPDTLSHKLAVWDAIARVPLLDLESHAEPSWVAVLLGQGRGPAAYDPAIDALDGDRLAALFVQRRAVLDKAAAAVPRHDTFIARTCAAEAA